MANAVMPMQSEAFALVEEVKRTSDVDTVIGGMQRVAATVGADTVVFASLPRSSGKAGGLFVVKDAPAEWIARYFERRYYEVDPVVHRLKRAPLPFEWNATNRDDSDPLADAVMRDRHMFGLRQGLIIPVPRRNGIACLALAGDRLEISPTAKSFFHLMGIYAFEAIKDLLEPRAISGLPALSDREREVLRWIAVGKTAWEIGQILGITKRTVDAHVYRAMWKLGAVNRTQGVALALRHGLIDT